MLTRLESNSALAVVALAARGNRRWFLPAHPALHEGQLAGSSHDETGKAAPWHIVTFNPGSDPLRALAEAILRAADLADQRRFENGRLDEADPEELL
jgi:hypothetical protein